MKMYKKLVFITIVLALCIMLHRRMKSAKMVLNTPQKMLKGFQNLPFLKGCSSSGFQNEGDTPPSGWKTYVERVQPNAEFPNHIDLDVFENDILLLKKMNGNTYRFSVEFSRVMPFPDVFDCTYYVNICKILQKHGLQPVITLFHFVLPPWAKDVWIISEDYFVTFATRVVQALDFCEPIWITLNEPYLFALHGYMIGVRPPFISDTLTCLKVLKNMLKDHVKIYVFCKDIRSTSLVGIAKNVMPVHANISINIVDQLIAYNFDNWFNNSFFKFINTGLIDLELLTQRQRHNTLTFPVVDFFGANHYTEMSIGMGLSPFEPITVNLRPPYIEYGSAMGTSGWFVTPTSWTHVFSLIKHNTDLPILVTECGVSDVKQSPTLAKREDAMADILYCMSCEPRIRGVLVWTLVDNVEWENDVKFGIFNETRLPTDVYSPISTFFRRY